MTYRVNAARNIIHFGRGGANNVYHTFRYTDKAGLSRSQVMGAVQRNIRLNLHRLDGPTKGIYSQRVYAGGRIIEYNAYRLPDGTINVGSIAVP